MKKNLLQKNSIRLLTIPALALLSMMNGQVIIYQQNFDGNNGSFTNAIVSQNTPTNGWLTSSTAPQYDNYRHVWNFSNVTTGGNADVLPISGRSLGMGFWNGNAPNVTNQFFRTWDGEVPESGAFFTTRWAHVGASTVGYENITVEFKWRCTGEVDGGIVYDYGTVNTSIDGGATWLMDLTGGQSGTTDTLGSFAGGLYYGNSGVQTATLTLPASRANRADFRLAFRMVVDEGYGTGGSFIIDDIIIRGTPFLATTDADVAKIEAYKDGENFVVKSPSEITKIELYDASGKLVSTMNGGNKEVRFGATQLTKGMYLLKVTMNNGGQVTKKIRK